MNDGFINETNLEKYIHNKTFSSLNKNMQNFLKFVFADNLDIKQPFYVKKTKGQIKPDLCIKHNGIEKYISIKKGSGNSVHQEKITDFFPFIEQVVGTSYVNYLKKFHYGDDTIDDTGKNRYTARECKKRYEKELEYLNIKLNQKDILLQFLNRFLFVGNIGQKAIDVVYHGTIDNGLWASKKEIEDYTQTHVFIRDAVHFGPLTYQVWGRNEKRKAKHPERRYIMQIKWSSICEDLEIIRKENK